MPLVLPPVVTGYLLLLLLGRRGPLGAWLEQTFGLVFAFRWTGAVVAAAVVAFPLMVRPIRLSLEAIDRRLESAAATLGAGRLWTWLTVTLPLSLPGMVVGAILGFTRSLGEFGATITFVSNIPGETRTLSLAVHSALQVPGNEPRAMAPHRHHRAGHPRGAGGVRNARPLRRAKDAGPCLKSTSNGASGTSASRPGSAATRG